MRQNCPYHKKSFGDSSPVVDKKLCRVDDGVMSVRRPASKANAEREAEQCNISVERINLSWDKGKSQQYANAVPGPNSDRAPNPGYVDSSLPPNRSRHLLYNQDAFISGIVDREFYIGDVSSSSSSNQRSSVSRSPSSHFSSQST